MGRLDRFAPQALGEPYEGDAKFRWSALEIQFEGNLPRSMFTLLQESSGASIHFGASVYYRPRKPSPWTGRDGLASLEMLFGLTDDKNGLHAQFLQYYDRIPNECVPIGGAPGGNLLCIGVRGSKKGEVYFWDHDDERPPRAIWGCDYGNMYSAAASFDKFIPALCTTDDPRP